MKKGKRGITNIEMIIATTIFVFCVVFVVYYVSFVGLRQEPPQVFLDILEQRLREESEVSYNVTPLLIKGSGACFEISKHFTITEEDNTFIKKASGGGIDFKISGDDLLVEDPSSSVVMIYTFPYKVTDHEQPSDCNETQNYDYGITSQSKIFVYESLTNLKSQPYGSWKSAWGLQKDFIINVTKSNGDIIVNLSHTKALEVPVLAKQFPITVIDENGEIFDASVNLQVW